jgi:hypothetical protein
MQFKNWFFAALLCAAVLVPGCASFRNHEVADVGAMPEASLSGNKPSVYVETHFYRGEPGSGAAEMTAMTSKIQEIIGTSLAEQALFSKYSFNDEDKAVSDYVLKVDVFNHGNAALAFAAGFVTGYTLGLVPSAATDNYTLQATLSDKAGTVVGEASNKDSITTWMGVWLLPAMANTPDKALTGTLDNQLRAVLKEFFGSGKLKYSRTGVYLRELRG